MGKSTTASMFADEGLPVWDADAAVHRLYAPGGGAVPAIASICPEAVGADGVDRAALKDWIARDPGALKRIEAVVHPLVAQDRAAFLDRAESDIVVLDIPLLFESGVEADCDLVVVVTATPEIQRARVLARPQMSEELFDKILARQEPDASKRSKADYIIDTGHGLEEADRQVRETLNAIGQRFGVQLI